MFQELPVNVPDVLAIRVSGKLTHADYKAFLPRLDASIRKHGKISLLVELEDFKGWGAEAAWDDLDFGLEHDRDFERIAIVGEKSWQHWMTALSNLFIHTPLRFFPREEAARAREWLNEGSRVDEPVAAYRHILLTTDFSAHSRRAAGRAAEMAVRYGARLSLLHVIEDPTFFDELYDPPIILDRDDLLADRMTQARIRLDDLVRGLSGIEAREVGSVVLHGSPKSVIPAYARTRGVDLIIVGSHGRGGVRRLLGSVADAVSHGANCDVLTVRI